MVSLCISGWPGTYFVDQAIFKLRRTSYFSLIAGVQGECKYVLLKFILLNAAEALSFMTDTSLSSFSLALKNSNILLK